MTEQLKVRYKNSIKLGYFFVVFLFAFLKHMLYINVVPKKYFVPK